jgi:4-hydroxyphenylacetate 3-monooxygenase
MGILNGAAYLDSLDDGRDIRIDGESVADVRRDPRFSGAAQTMAALYQMQHAPELAARLTYASPDTGAPVGLSFIQPRTPDDLVRRRDMIKTWMDATCGMFGRSPDFMNVHVAGIAAAWPDFNRGAGRFGDNLRDFYVHARENDLAMTHTLANPQVDRSKSVENQDKDLAAKVVKETDAGIVVRGARMVSTLCAYSHEIVVMPPASVRTGPGAEPYAFGFSIPVATSGLRFICRPSLVHQNAASPMDFPLSSRLDETDGMVIFNDVLVPWERVFIHRDPEMCNGVYETTGANVQIMTQSTIRSLAKAEFMMGLAFAMAKSTGVEGFLNVQGMLAEMITATETLRACLTASEVGATRTRHGVLAPASQPLWASRMLMPKLFPRMCEIIQLLGAGGLVSVPSHAEWGGEARADIETYFQAANAGSEARIKLFRLAFDAAVSSFSGRQQLYERYYTGDPVRLAGVLYSRYPKAPFIDRVWDMLGSVETAA